MTLKTATKAEVQQLARDLVGPEIEAAKDAAIEAVTARMEQRIASIAERMAALENRLHQGVTKTQNAIAAQAELISRSLERKDFAAHVEIVADGFDDLEAKLVEAGKWQPILESVLERLDGLDEGQKKLTSEFERLRDGALSKLLDEVREQAKERDKTLYRRIEELAAKATGEIKTEKEKMLAAFRAMTRMMDERSQTIRDLDEKVRQKLVTHGKAHQELLREFEALKSGVRIGKGE